MEKQGASEEKRLAALCSEEATIFRLPFLWPLACCGQMRAIRLSVRAAEDQPPPSFASVSPLSPRNQELSVRVLQSSVFWSSFEVGWSIMLDSVYRSVGKAFLHTSSFPELAGNKPTEETVLRDLKLHPHGRTRFSGERRRSRCVLADFRASSAWSRAIASHQNYCSVQGLKRQRDLPFSIVALAGFRLGGSAAFAQQIGVSNSWRIQTWRIAIQNLTNLLSRTGFRVTQLKVRGAAQFLVLLVGNG